MSSTETRNNEAGDPIVVRDDMKLEAVVIPVSDVDRAKQFYEQLGWRLDADLGDGKVFRIVQFTPPGSGCSIQFGVGLTSAAPGAAQNLLVVSDIVSAHDDLVARGVDTSGVFHDSSGGYNRFDPDLRASGPDPERRDLRVVRRRSTTPTATSGNCRRSRAASPAGSTRPLPPTPVPTTSPVRCGAPRPRTANTRPASAKQTRTGPTGTPPTWSPSRPAPSSPPDRTGCGDMSDEPALAGQTVVLIGGSAGIGLETARRAREEGANVDPHGSRPRSPPARRRARSRRRASPRSTPRTSIGSERSSTSCPRDRPRAGHGTRSVLRTARGVRPRRGAPRRRGPPPAADAGRARRAQARFAREGRCSS